MKIIRKSFRSVNELQDHILSKKPSLYISSQTSTVIPYDKLESLLESRRDLEELSIVNLMTLSQEMELDESGVLTISGPVTWKEARSFCRSKGRDIMTAPTEELASILAGLATSATGERCFGFGNLRKHIKEITYLNNKGEIKVLNSSRSLSDSDLFKSDEDKMIFNRYQDDFELYKEFKNAPFPRFEKETDLLIGTEGQLGVITSAKIETTKYEENQFIYIRLPKWEEDFEPHKELYEKVQNFRDSIHSCEFFDSNSLSVLPKEESVSSDGDLAFLEIAAKDFERVYEELISNLKLVNEEEMFELTANRSQELRMAIPRYTFERNSRMGVTKKGTDVQMIGADNFEKLIGHYREFSKHGIAYNLFGHFGDAHLHFNFMPLPEQEEFCNQELAKLYKNVAADKGSPFAEHGIGLIKQQFITQFWDKNQFEMFKLLKEKMDENNIFYPIGFMCLGSGN